jgi:hypothetical protein
MGKAEVGPWVAREDPHPLRSRFRVLRENAMMPAMLDNKGTKILAKSLFKELRGNG